MALATPSAITLYGARPDYSDALVIAISQSGRSPDIVAVVDEARRQGAPTIVLTNDTDSPLADSADHAISHRGRPGAGHGRDQDLHDGAAGRGSAVRSAGSVQRGGEERRGPSSGADVSGARDGGRGARGRSTPTPTGRAAVVLGRGYCYATAREWALKLQEMAQLLAVPYSTADFEHGPMALAERGFAVLAVAPSGPPLDAQMSVLERLRDVHGAQVLVISDDAAARAIDRGLALPAGVPGWLSPIVDIMPGQLYAYHLTRARGFDPDRPRTISKVTETT